MNWVLILGLSLFGLVMGVATVFVIPSTIEPAFWLAIFVISAVAIATRAPGRPFLHGLCVSLVNSVWITGVHVLLFRAYAARHGAEIAMMGSRPRLMLLLTGPIFGLVSGCVLGVFAIIAAKLLGRRRAIA